MTNLLAPRGAGEQGRCCGVVAPQTPSSPDRPQRTRRAAARASRSRRRLPPRCVWRRPAPAASPPAACTRAGRPHPPPQCVRDARPRRGYAPGAVEAGGARAGGEPRRRRRRRGTRRASRVAAKQPCVRERRRWVRAPERAPLRGHARLTAAKGVSCRPVLRCSHAARSRCRRSAPEAASPAFSLAVRGVARRRAGGAGSAAAGARAAPPASSSACVTARWRRSARARAGAPGHHAVRRGAAPPLAAASAEGGPLRGRGGCSAAAAEVPPGPAPTRRPTTCASNAPVGAAVAGRGCRCCC